MIVNDYDLRALYNYYKDYTLNESFLLLLNRNDFHSKLIKDKIVLVSYKAEINGFLSASISEEKAYINLVYGEEDILINLLSALENYLIENNVFEIWNHFFNPVKLAWYPKPDVIHPAIQGVVLKSQLYDIYSRLAYIDHSIQQTYYQDLSHFDITKYKNNQTNYNIAFYNPLKHKGLNEFAENIGVQSWKEEIINNQNLDDPLPLLVALDSDKVIGFTGPIKVESSSRGYFAGIAILQNYRKMGIGNALFLRLCHELKNIGAQYMTFFTGTKNPAKYIYLKAGFQVVETFVTMKKLINRR